MTIFTFMGASVMRQDDSYSFEVITKTLDTVIPALIQVCECHHAFIVTWIQGTKCNCPWKILNKNVVYL